MVSLPFQCGKCGHLSIVQKHVCMHGMYMNTQVIPLALHCLKTVMFDTCLIPIWKQSSHSLSYSWVSECFVRVFWAITCFFPSYQVNSLCLSSFTKNLDSVCFTWSKYTNVSNDHWDHRKHKTCHHSYQSGIHGRTSNSFTISALVVDSLNTSFRNIHINWSAMEK